MKEVSVEEARRALRVMDSATKIPMYVSADSQRETLERFINQVEEKSIKGMAKKMWLRFTTIQFKSP